MDRGRKFVCTIWDEWLPEFDPEIFSYGIFGYEQAPSTGQWHWQGYFETFTKRSNVRLAKILGCAVHPYVEHARGSQEENEKYCTKDGQVIEFGVKMKQGERHDLKKLVDDIMSGETTMDEIVLERPLMYYQFGRVLQAANNIRLKRLKHPDVRTVEWIYGPAGCGKSRYVNSVAPNAYVWRDDDFQEYQGEPDIIIEEFRGTTMSIDKFLKLTDPHYSNLWLKRKHDSFVPAVPSRIFITSNFSPEEIFNVGEHPQILRRMKVTKM